MNYVLAFLIGGAICMLGQLIQDLFKLTPGHITSIFVMLGAGLELFDIYDKLIKILDKKLESILIEADDEMNFYYYNAVKKIGKYFAYKEIIKVSNFFKNRRK